MSIFSAIMFGATLVATLLTINDYMTEADNPDTGAYVSGLLLIFGLLFL